MSLISAVDNAIQTLENTISTILGLAENEMANAVGFFNEFNFDGVKPVANTTTDTK